MANELNNRMEEIIKELENTSLSNYDYQLLMEELFRDESKTETVLPNSPTQTESDDYQGYSETALTLKDLRVISEMDSTQKTDYMKELIFILNEASEEYYNDRDEIMSNYEWDYKFDKLSYLEKSTGIILDDSPTQSTGADEDIEGGQKEEHEFPALSLAKNKDVAVLRKWAGNRPIWLSWKLDGLTLVITYNKGKISKLMTRGDGIVGTNITYLAPYIKGYPQTIKDKGHFVVRGEAIISYTDFNLINELIEDEQEKYANPRNLVSGTLSLDKTRAKEVSERNVAFNAFTLVYTDEEIKSWGKRMQYLEDLGFNVVDREETTAEELQDVIDKWTERVKSGDMKIPVDGLVIAYDDTEYAATGSVTGHHATNAGMAFKWADKPVETILDHIEWSCATATISPVAVFDSREIEGTTVSRASLCNISEMKRLGIGADRKTKLKVIKANMIIPKVIEAEADGTTFEIPKVCPVCGAPTEIHIGKKTETETLHCTNPKCTAKQVKKYARFVSKTGMDIDGLSVETVVKFINNGFIKDFTDIYSISDHKAAIINMDGFGEKSYENIVSAVEKSKKVSPVNFLYALCIPLIGTDAGKKIFAAIGSDGFFERLKKGEGFEDIDGIGPEKSNAFINWYADDDNKKLLDKLFDILEVGKVEAKKIENGRCQGLTFVITGDVEIFKNRSEFKAYVESEGGSVTGSVSKKTNYLVNNDVDSTSGKNQKAKDLDIPIINERAFVELFKD